MPEKEWKARWPIVKTEDDLCVGNGMGESAQMMEVVNRGQEESMQIKSEAGGYAR